MLGACDALAEGSEEDAPTLERVTQLVSSPVPVQRVLSISLLVDFLSDSAAASHASRAVLTELLYEIAKLPLPPPRSPAPPAGASARRSASSPAESHELNAPGVPSGQLADADVSPSAQPSPESPCAAAGAPPGVCTAADASAHPPSFLSSSATQDAPPGDDDPPARAKAGSASSSSLSPLSALSSFSSPSASSALSSVPRVSLPSSVASSPVTSAGRLFSALLSSGGSLGSALSMRFGGDASAQAKNVEKAAGSDADDGALVAVRKALCARSGDIAACLIQADPYQGYRRVYEDLLPLFEQLVHTAPEWTTKKAAADAILLLATHLRAKERLEQVLPIALRLSNSLEHAELRLLAVGFLHLLFDISSSVVAAHFILPQLLFLADEDPDATVRRCALRHVAAVASSLEPALFSSRVLPSFLRLLRGRRARGVGGVDPHTRAAVVCSLYDLAKASRLSVRLRLLLPAVQELLEDPSAVVRFAAQQQLGRFLSSVGGCLDPEYAAEALREEAAERARRRSEGRAARARSSGNLSLSSFEGLCGGSPGTVRDATASPTASATSSLPPSAPAVDGREEEAEEREAEEAEFSRTSLEAASRAITALLRRFAELASGDGLLVETLENELAAPKDDKPAEERPGKKRSSLFASVFSGGKQAQEEREDDSPPSQLLPSLTLDLTPASASSAAAAACTCRCCRRAGLLSLQSSLSVASPSSLSSLSSLSCLSSLPSFSSLASLAGSGAGFAGLPAAPSGAGTLAAFASLAGASPPASSPAAAFSSSGSGEPVAHSAACCAFAFAAVATAARSRGWALLSEAFIVLVRHQCKHVRKSMAASFHLLAAAALARPRPSPAAPALGNSAGEAPRDRGGARSEEEVRSDARGEEDAETRLVDREATERVFLSALESFLLDGDVDIQMAVLGNIAQIVAAFSPTSRLGILGTLQTVVFTSELFWSSRLLLAQQLEALFLLQDPQLRTDLLSLAFTLLQDSVAIVRKAACRCTPALLSSCCKDLVAAVPARPMPRFVHELSRLRKASDRRGPRGERRGSAQEAQIELQGGVAEGPRSGERGPENPLSGSPRDADKLRRLLTKGEQASVICDILETFAESPRFTSRQLFIHMADQVIRHCPRSLFEIYFMRALAYLSSDRVANVRLTWAKLLLPHLRKPNGKLKDNCLLVCAAKSLRKTERDREMRLLLESCAFAEDEDLQVVDGLELRDFDRGSRSLSESRGSSEDSEGAPGAEMLVGESSEEDARALCPSAAEGDAQGKLGPTDETEEAFGASGQHAEQEAVAGGPTEGASEPDLAAEEGTQEGDASPAHQQKVEEDGAGAEACQAQRATRLCENEAISEGEDGGLSSAGEPSAGAGASSGPDTVPAAAAGEGESEADRQAGKEASLSGVEEANETHAPREGLAREARDRACFSAGLEPADSDRGAVGRAWSPTHPTGTGDPPASGRGASPAVPAAPEALRNGAETEGRTREPGASPASRLNLLLEQEVDAVSAAKHGAALSLLEKGLDEAAEAEWMASVYEAERLSERGDKASESRDLVESVYRSGGALESVGLASRLCAPEAREGGSNSSPLRNAPHPPLRVRPSSPSSLSWRTEESGEACPVVVEDTFRDKTEDTLDAIYGMPRSPQIAPPPQVVGMVEDAAVGRGSYWSVDSPQELQSAISADVSVIEAVEAFWGQPSDEEAEDEEPERD